MKYQITEDGSEQRICELVSGTLYTTEEMLNRAIPDYDVCYVAKWSDTSLASYFNEAYVHSDYLLCGNGGQITMESAVGDGDVKKETCDYFECHLEDGLSVADSWKKQGLHYVESQKPCSELMGWQVFSFQDAEWVEVPVGESVEVAAGERYERVFRMYEDDVPTMDVYVVMKDYKDMGVMTTDEAFALSGGANRYLVKAVWDTGHTEGAEIRENVLVENGHGTYTSNVYCTECGELLKSWIRDFTVEIQEVTLPGSESPARVEIASKVMDVPDEISEQYGNVGAVRDAMISSTVEESESITEKNIKSIFIDVELQVQDENGNWEMVSGENFPEEGISILLPYPEGTDMSTEGFVVSHMISEGEDAGMVETLSYTKEEKGLRVTVTSLSPMMVAYAQENPFGDVKETDWYYSYTMFAFEKELMGGKGTTADGKVKFDPANTITRAEFVQMLYSKEEKPAVEYKDTFTDVPDGRWYTDAIMWASENQIAGGKKEDFFDVSGRITRQEIAVILYKYAAFKGYDVTNQRDTSLAGFADAAAVAKWGETAMKWAVGNDVIGGKTAKDGMELSPNGNAIRAEAATMMRSFMVEIEGIEE